MRRVLFIVLAVSVVTLVACNASEQSQTTATLDPVPPEYAGKTNPLDADSTSRGADVFKTNCEACHGPQGHGDGPAGAALDPAPKNLPELSTVAGDDYLFWRIATGKAGTAMVGWKGVLSEEQIWQVISYIHTLK